MLFLIGGTRVQAAVVIVKVWINAEAQPRSIPYSLHRLLRISDFEGKPDAASPGVAATYSGMKMGFSAETEDGKTVVQVFLSAYFKTNVSWMKPEGKTPAVLAHEQLHFDLTAIQTCRLLRAIENTSFSDNWQQQLMALRNHYLKELQRLQQEYDRETRHGSLPEVQQRYEKAIKSQLSKLDCYRRPGH